MTPSEYLDALRVKLNAPSDYALQKPLGLSKSALSNYRHNKDFFSDEVAAKVADILEKRPAFVIIDMHQQRAKTPDVRNYWREIAEGFIALVFPANVGQGNTPA